MQLYDPRQSADIQRLIAEYPLAWVVSGGFSASPLPLIGETDAEGNVVSLLGHCGLNNALVADFSADPRGLILFKGPDGYVGPGLVSKPDWAPTWNYAVLRFKVEVEFIPEATPGAVEELVEKMEGGGWSTDVLGLRREQLLARIIAFRAHVRSTNHTFKLGQDESDQGFAEIVSAHPDRTLSEWMEGQSKR